MLSATLVYSRTPGGQTKLSTFPGDRHMVAVAAPAALLVLVQLSNAAVGITAIPPNETCRSPLDCCGSPCSGGVCTCDQGYTGRSCCALALGECSIAVNPNQTWTWGAAPRWTAAGTVEVMAMGLRNRCGINNCAFMAVAHSVQCCVSSTDSDPIDSHARRPVQRGYTAGGIAHSFQPIRCRRQIRAGAASTVSPYMMTTTHA